MVVGKPQKREEWKWSLVRGLYDRGIVAINKIEDMTELQRLLMASVTINSLVDFGQLLPKNLDSNLNNNN